MKALFFHAAAREPRVAAGVMSQAWNTLRPFYRFLGQAIHTAKQRQVRYQLLWERVRDLATLRIEAVDTRVRVPMRVPGVIIKNWPADRVADDNLHGFVINRSLPVRVEIVASSAHKLCVRIEPPLLPADRLIWCGVECVIEHEPPPSPPTRVTDASGRALRLLSVAADDTRQFWHLVIEGVIADGELLVDGEGFEAAVLPSAVQRVFDGSGRAFDVKDGLLRVRERPSDGPLRGDDGLRYRWFEASSQGRRGFWLRLRPPETVDADATIDPRAAFCEGDVSEVWTQARHRPETSYKVKRVDADRYELLLDRLPPEGSTLFLPVDVRNLYLQKRALRQLAEAPLPHHAGLLRLCEDPERVQWPGVKPVVIAEGGWKSLSDGTRNGTDEQRRFVARALGSPDLAILEGPPGSGKTTAICEIVQQFIEQGQRVLLCASTHVAIDNVLERLVKPESPIDAVRIGKADKVDDNVAATRLDARVEALVARWRESPAMAGLGDGEREEMAERTVIMAANLTCGTTMGIVNHPLFRGRDTDLQVAERPITTLPHWDVLIIDEASKTLIQEFLVPALMARRWIIVGDVHQLPPFADRDDIVANLRDLVDDKDRPIFPPDHQRACLLRFRLARRDLRQTGSRWLLVERPGVLDHLARELDAEPVRGLMVVRVVARIGRSPRGERGAPPGAKSVTVEPVTVEQITVDQIRRGAPAALRLAAADWVLVGDDVIADVSRWLPSTLLQVRELARGASAVIGESDALMTRQAWWLARVRSLAEAYRDRSYGRDAITTPQESQACETKWLANHDLAQEITWRLTRLHELRRSKGDRQRRPLRDELGRLKPRTASIGDALAEIEDIGLPSILEVLQEGIGADRTKRPSALTMGFCTSRRADFNARFVSLSHQHRMHPQIAEFSRDVIYGGAALHDANTITSRDERLGWDFGPFDKRFAWADVEGRDRGGVNDDEVAVVEGIARAFIAWARKKGPPAHDTAAQGTAARWEVACLSFYVKQERALSDMLRKLTGDERRTRFAVPGVPVEIVCGTVDRFQGREADLVLLSMRNTGRTGFLDSPNRLNVAVTRARQQLVVVGNAGYFKRCGIAELQALAERTARVDLRRFKQGAR